MHGKLIIHFTHYPLTKKIICSNPYQSAMVQFETEEKSPISLISCRPSIGETASAVSTPASHVTNLKRPCSTDGLLLTQQSCSFHFDPKVDMEPEDDFTVLFEKKMKEGGKRSFNFKDLFKRNRAMEDECFSSSQFSHYELESEISEISPVRKDSFGGPSHDNAQSPSVQSFLFEADKNNHECLDDLMSTCDQQEVDLRHQNCHKTTLPTTLHNNNIITNDTTIPTHFLYTFEAPIPLGIVIHSNMKQKTAKPQTPHSIHSKQNYCLGLGPTVHQIKGYSPLLGMVNIGDIIISIDGTTTKHMSTVEITSLLSRLQSEKSRKDGKIKVTVLSKDLKVGFEPDLSGFNYSNDLGVVESSTREATDDEYENNSIQSSNHSYGSFHLIGTGVPGDDDSLFYMMEGADNYL